MNELDSLTNQLEASNANNLIFNEQQSLLRERLLDEERKNEQLRQCVQQLQQQKSSLLNQIGSNTASTNKSLNVYILIKNCSKENQILQVVLI